VDIETVLDDDPVGPIPVDERANLAQAPPLARLLPPTRPLEVPVDEGTRPVEDREPVAPRDGIDGENALHSALTDSDADPEVM
jgi:hypothetical protein